MSLPVVAIIGRPNVGKSSFFNFVSGKRISIVEDTPGVTRDRIYEKIEWRGRYFNLVDTGGLEPNSQDTILRQMRIQASAAADLADVILFMVDGQEGVTADDKEIATMLRKINKKIILVVNKVDNIGEPPADVYDFYNLGLGDFFTISSTHGLGLGEVLDEIVQTLPEDSDNGDDEECIRVAVVGKPNAGKSSLINKILGEARVIVSDIPGTTRDAIDTYTEKDGQKFCFIDTAGMRKRGKITDNIERYSTMRSLTAIDRAQVVVIMIDAQDGVTEQDTKIAGYAHNQGKAAVIAVNKWDLIEKDTNTMENFRKDVMNSFNFMMYAPVIFISALTGQRVGTLYDTILKVYTSATRRITTGMLNDCMNECIQAVQPPSDKGKRLKLYYMTQVSVCPPTFVIKCNSKDLFHFSYQRYIENQVRKSFDFTGTPVVFKIREKDEKDVD